MSAALCLVALIAVPASAAVPSLASADAYVRSIYRSIPTPRFDYRTVRYTKELADLMQRDQAAAQGEVGVIDSVPFCDCQDNDPNYAIVASHAVPLGSDGARVAVTLRNGEVGHFAVDLQVVGGMWRVADIHGPNTPSLLAMLRRSVPHEEVYSRRQ